MTLSWSVTDDKHPASSLTSLECRKSWENGFKLQKINVFLLGWGFLTLKAFLPMRRSISRAGTVTLSDQHLSVAEAFLRILSSGFQPLPTRNENRPTKGEEGKHALPQLPARERECEQISVYRGTGGRLSPTQEALECIQHFRRVPPCAPLDTGDTGQGEQVRQLWDNWITP